MQNSTPHWSLTRNKGRHRYLPQKKNHFCRIHIWFPCTKSITAGSSYATSWWTTHICTSINRS